MHIALELVHNQVVVSPREAQLLLELLNWDLVGIIERTAELVDKFEIRVSSTATRIVQLRRLGRVYVVVDRRIDEADWSTYAKLYFFEHEGEAREYFNKLVEEAREEARALF